MLTRHEPETHDMIPLQPRIVKVVAQPQTETMARIRLAVPIGSNRIVCFQSSAASLRSIASKKSRFQKLSRYCVNSCKRTVTTNNPAKSHASQADRPCQKPEALCQKRASNRFSSGRQVFLLKHTRSVSKRSYPTSHSAGGKPGF